MILELGFLPGAVCMESGVSMASPELCQRSSLAESKPHN